MKHFSGNAVLRAIVVYYAFFVLVSAIVIIGMHFLQVVPPTSGGHDKRCMSDKKQLVVVILSWVPVTGPIGVDRFYTGYIGLGVAKLLTAGGLGIWYLVDAIMFTMGQISDHDGCQLIPM